MSDEDHDDDELRREREDAALDVESAGVPLSVGGFGEGDRPDQADLPDNPPEPPVSLWARLLRAVRGR